MTPDQVVTVVSLISLATATVKLVSEILASRNPQEKMPVF
jgi:hypothetical protein